MKSLIYVFLVLGLSLLGAIDLSAQVGGESRMGNGGSYWIFGLNAGGAWQDSDVKARAGGGWGFYMGPSIYNKPNAFFSADLRFRYLNTYTYGQNHRDRVLGNSILSPPNFNYDPATKAFAHNHRTVFHDLSLELRVNFEELRRKSNIWLSLYGGVGLGIYGTTFDQKDAAGNDYDYESIDQTQTDRQICSDILGMRDDVYETSAFGLDRFDDNRFKLGFMPSVGIELGYWFTPYFALGIGHRVTFTQDDFEGVRVDNGSPLSMHHYTSFMLHWRVKLDKRKVACPNVDFELPTSNGLTYETNQPTVFVKATVANVSQSQIIYTINGQQSTNFSYDPSTDAFQSNLPLQVGENRIVLKAKNSCGTSGQGIVVIYNPQQDPNTTTQQPPIVSITNPANSPIRVTEPTINIYAQLLHVASKRDVVFSVNGNTGYAFSFSGTSFQATNINLVQGQNTITIKGSNKDGSDTKTVIINYQKEEPLPLVNITNPRTNPYTTTATRINLSATILNVATKNDITFTVNGQVSPYFNFSGTAFSASNINLVQGSNTITITGRNSKGQDSKSIVVIYKEEELPPVVQITQPSANPYTTTANTVNIQARILNVVGAQNVTYTVNGRARNDFSFGGDRFSAQLTLTQGNNSITITGRNKDGQDSKTTVIIYQKQVERPRVTITAPRANPYISSTQVGQVSATITNVTGRHNVTCTVNGQMTTNFSFSNTSFNLSNIQLGEGNNTITITGRNQAGQDSKSTIIVYRPVVVQRPPEVSIVAPNKNPYTTQASKETVSAIVDNVNNRNDITCTVNGRVNQSFSFSGNSLTLANLNLVEGSNSITITARNTAGQDSKTTVIIYKKAVQLPRPVVTIVEPRSNPYTIRQSRTNLRATILNVAGRNDVTCTFNGAAWTGFTFSGTNFVANNLNLRPGNNTITITGRNASGQDSKSTVIIFEEPIWEPSVVITSPSQNPWTSASATAQINATIKHVGNRNDVTFMVNGQNNTNFSFSGTNFVATGVQLNTGSNTLVVSGRNASGQATATTTIVYRPTPAPVVSITSPNQNPWTTANGTVNLSAVIQHVDSKSGVTLTINGQATSNFNFSNNKLTANNIRLRAGNNTITVTGRNASGQDSKSTVIIFEEPVGEPSVVITTPSQNPWTSASATAQVNATIKNVTNRNDVTFMVNGQNNTNFSFSGTSFVATGVQLNTGSNTLVVSGRNASGQATATTTIVYRPVPAPVVSITSPNQNPWATANGTVNLSAVIQHVDSKSGVTLTVNGQAVTNFSFSNNNLTANNITLRKGNNTITVTGRNASGQDSKSTVVILDRPNAAPVVTITEPRQNPFMVKSNTITIKATITNIDSRDDVTFTVNGQANTGFSFSGTNFVGGNIKLREGNNTIVITAQNSQGQDSKSTIVVYNAPVAKPVVMITNPAQSPFTTLSSRTNINATIMNVDNRNNITFTVNGRANQNYTFNGTSFSANALPLNVGNNTIVITGKNMAGQDSKTSIIVYKLPEKRPSVVITEPNVNPFNTSNSRVNIKATVLNVLKREGIIFKVNGQLVTNFSLNGTSFVANNVALQAGNNTIELTGKNGAGQVTATTMVIYNIPVQEPSVVINMPNQNPWNTTANKVNIIATIRNVASKSKVSFKVNGQNNSNFSFNGTSFVANNVVLNSGSNTLIITGMNASGQAVARQTIVYNPANPSGGRSNKTGSDSETETKDGAVQKKGAADKIDPSTKKVGESPASGDATKKGSTKKGASQKQSTIKKGENVLPNTTKKKG